VVEETMMGEGERKGRGGRGRGTIKSLSIESRLGLRLNWRMTA